MILYICRRCRLNLQWNLLLLLKSMSKICLKTRPQPDESYIPEFFRDVEFIMATPSCNLSDMDSYFLQKLDYLRKLCEFPIVINSAYRSVEWDQEHGRTGNSYHCAGRAVDIRCLDSHKRGVIVQNAHIAGLNGIGISKTFIHLDDRAIPRIWLYD